MEFDAPPAETVTHDETVIWRYMDLPRFVSILSTSTLWFAKASTLRDDPWEGFGKAEYPTPPSPDDSPKFEQEAPDGGRTRIISLPQMLAKFTQRSAEIFENARDHLYVNSWCLDESESMAMWQIYGSLGFGVALKSSVKQYKPAARFEVDPSHYIFGEVVYHPSLESSPDIQRDFRESTPMPGRGLSSEVLKLGLHKRACYWYEHEWRAVLYQDHRPGIAGVHEAFDLDQLISAVYVGPRAEGFVVEAVSSIMDKFLLRKPLKRSLLLSSPQKAISPVG
jgi:hypothetical protein